MQTPNGRIRIFQRKEKTEPAVPAHPRTAAIVVAAGGSTRMGVPKQLIPLLGIPVIARTLMAFNAAQNIDEIVLVARPADLLNFYDICKTYGITKVTNILQGGETRQKSVMRGVYAASDLTAYFAIHDGARPLIRPTVIDEITAAAYACGAAAAGVPVKDTIKMVDENGMIVSTPDRRFLWNVQTPQVFERRLYLNALRCADAVGAEYTDDCQLVEQMGHPVRLLQGDYANIKITTPEDVAFAEGILRERGERF